MYDSKISFRMREQLEKFLGIFSPHFSKPATKFLGEMLYGVQVAQDVLLSEIGRALDEDISLKKTEDRLSRNLKNDKIEERVHAALLADAAGHVGENTLVIVDPTDIQKQYAEKMPLLAKVWDGSRGEVGENLGYNSCAVVACENGGRRIVPVRLSLWSTKEDGFTSENDKIKDNIKKVADGTGHRGVYVYDRGGDGDWLFDFLIGENLGFLVRLVGNRNLVSWGRTVLAEDLARQVTMVYADTVQFKIHNRIVDVGIQFGSVPVRLPTHPGRRLNLVVVKWPKCDKPMMLLTTVDPVASRKALYSVVKGYLTRWRIEETIRYVKQSYNLENLRLLNWQRLKNMAAIVAAVAYFAAVWIGKSAKLSVLVDHVTRISKRMYEVPEFYYYAIADGISWLFARHGRWRGVGGDPGKVEDSRQMEFDFG